MLIAENWTKLRENLTAYENFVRRSKQSHVSKKLAGTVLSLAYFDHQRVKFLISIMPISDAGPSIHFILLCHISAI